MARTRSFHVQAITLLPHACILQRKQRILCLTMEGQQLLRYLKVLLFRGLAIPNPRLLRLSGSKQLLQNCGTVRYAPTQTRLSLSISGPDILNPRLLLQGFVLLKTPLHPT